MSFSTYAHSIHRSLLRSHPGLSIKLGQVHQLLSAALGHKSLASYQNAQPAESLGQQIIVNRNGLFNRFNELGLPGGLAEEFLAHFKSTANQIVHVHHSDYVKTLMDFVRDTIPLLPEVQDHLARIGARISFSQVDPIAFPEPMGIHSPILHAVSGTVELSTREGRPHPIRKLNFAGCVAVEVHGRRCLGAFALSGGLEDELDLVDQVVEYAYLPEDN